MLALNLDRGDWHQIELLQRIVDLRNIRALWLGQPLDPRGNFDEKGLEEALLVSGGLPDFVEDFLNRYETLEERLRYFSSLYSSLFSKESREELTGFLRSYYELEREIRLCLAALRAFDSKRDLLHEFQFEDPTDPLVAFLLAQKDSKDPVLPQEYEDLKTGFLENSSDPKKLYRAILEIRLSRIEDLEALKTFSIDQVLGYLARLAIVEDWAQLDDDRGQSALAQVCRE